MNYYRHGDISFHPITILPPKLKKLPIIEGKFICALGEATGHKHLLKEREAGSFEIYQDTQGRYVLDIKKPVELSHEEHKTITIERGIYIQEQEREYDYAAEAMKKVID